MNTIDIKNHLYSFALSKKGITHYYYETDGRYFEAEKPSKKCLIEKAAKKTNLPASKIIENPWNHWKNGNVQLIVSSDNVPINYLKTTDKDLIQNYEDKNLMFAYHDIIENYDLDNPLTMETVCDWHRIVFGDIYSFAGEYRSVEMVKDSDVGSFTWRVEFLKGIPSLSMLIQEKWNKTYGKDLISEISQDMSELMSELLFIHPFREGNGRISRLVCDIILAKNDLPLIGMNLKSSYNDYLIRVIKGYKKDYQPLAEIIMDKINEMMNK